MTKRSNPFTAARTWYVYADGFEMVELFGTADQVKAAFRKLHGLSKMPVGTLLSATKR